MKAVQGYNLSFRYPGGALLFQDVDIYVEPGECAALMGPSGCGKSTLCYILAGLIPTSIEGEVDGTVFLFGQKIEELTLAQRVRRVGLVFQDPDSQLFSPTVEDEIAFGPENLCLPREVIGRRVEKALAAVKMSAYRLAEPETLSYGQKQLIALAAVLALEPGLLILDEALSQLDSAHTARVKEIIEEQKRAGRGILMVEHDQRNLAPADRLYKMKAGRVKEVPL